MDKRQAILQATAKLIALHGLQNTPTSLIANEAGVGEGTIYRYFKDKEALVVTVYRGLIEDFNNAVTLEDMNSGFVKERFFVFYRNLFHFCQNNREKTALFDYLSISPLLKTVAEETTKHINQALIQLFIDGKAQQLIRNDVEIEVSMLFLFGAITTLAKKGLVSTEDQIETVLQMAWNSIQA